jgi:hypothetical protein
MMVMVTTDYPTLLLQVPRVRRSAEFPEAEKVEDPQVPPAARDLYEKAKYDIINNILSNF